MTYVEPARTMTPEENEAFLADAGLNGPFVAELLSDMLAHERCGAQLYRSVSQRTNSPVLRERCDRFGNETVEHVEILEGLITQPGRPDHREGRDGTAGVHVPVVRPALGS
jgi:ferritin-like metal-binding protein YciE